MYQNLIKPACIDVKNFVLDTLFPITCLACSQEGSLVCADCKSMLKQLEQQRCIVCQKQTPFGITHNFCQTPLGTDGLISFYDYHDDKIAQILIKGKYNFLPNTFTILAEIISTNIKKNYPELLESDPINQKPLLCPIPLHSTRKSWRGFNQAEVLCMGLSKGLGLETQNLLRRKKITQTQKNLKKEQRQTNMAGAFAMDKSVSAGAIRDRSILLVDDVTTTGSTLKAAAQVLKQNGAAKVICLTVARD